MTVTGPLLLSVIVPAYSCEHFLRACVNGLLASDLPRASWELIIVDDGSTDGTWAVAQEHADQALRTTDGPRGPAQARNVGARAASAPVLLFVDADVVVAPHTLRGVATHFTANPSLGAVFGAYDDTPADGGFISQYRNLLHHYVHTLHPGEADTFWAGCGAVRRDTFLAVGGFDAVRYPRPQIEDIELGYRLRAHHARIVLDPNLQGKHLKRWTFRNMVRTDLHERAIPWMHLILRRGEAMQRGPLNLRVREKLYTAFTAIAIVATLGALLFGNNALAYTAAFCVLVVLLGNAALLSWFGSRRGFFFAVGVAPLRLLYYAEAGIGACWAIATHDRHHRQAGVVRLPPLMAHEQAAS